MDLTTTILGGVLGGVIGAAAKKDKPWTYALWGGGLGLGVSLVGKVFEKSRPGFKVGDLPFHLPTPAQPGVVVYATDPRRDPRIDPVTRRLQFPTWALSHWQQGDRAVIAEVQQALGVPADGVVGPGTTSAVMAAQSRSGLPTTGVMDYSLMRGLSDAMAG